MEKRKVLERFVGCKAVLHNFPIMQKQQDPSFLVLERNFLLSKAGDLMVQQSSLSPGCRRAQCSCTGSGEHHQTPQGCSIPEDAPAAGPNFRCPAISWERARAEGERSHRPHQKFGLNQLLFLPWILILLSHQHYCKLQGKKEKEKEKSSAVSTDLCL